MNNFKFSKNISDEARNDIMDHIDNLIEEYKEAKINIDNADNSWDYDILASRIERLEQIFRSDLLEEKAKLPIEGITIYDFKNDALSPDEIKKAEYIIFVDGRNIIELKNRLAIKK